MDSTAEYGHLDVVEWLHQIVKKVAQSRLWMQPLLMVTSVFLPFLRTIDMKDAVIWHQLVQLTMGARNCAVAENVLPVEGLIWVLLL